MKKSSLSPPPKIEGETSKHARSHSRDRIVRHDWTHLRIEEEPSNKQDRSYRPRDHMVRHELAHVRDTRPAVMTRMEPPAEDVNDCAEAFIQRFRQQLHIQRLESIENYEQMLARGL